MGFSPDGLGLKFSKKHGAQYFFENRIELEKLTQAIRY